MPTDDQKVNNFGWNFWNSLPVSGCQGRAVSAMSIMYFFNWHWFQFVGSSVLPLFHLFWPLRRQDITVVYLWRQLFKAKSSNSSQNLQPQQQQTGKGRLPWFSNLKELEGCLSKLQSFSCHPTPGDVGQPHSLHGGVRWVYEYNRVHRIEPNLFWPPVLTVHVTCVHKNYHPTLYGMVGSRLTCCFPIVQCHSCQVLCLTKMRESFNSRWFFLGIFSGISFWCH